MLGHVQRGGSPTARDRVLATRFGLKAADLVDEGKFGRMAALRGDDVVDVSLEGGDGRAEARAGRLVRRRPRVLRLQTKATGFPLRHRHTPSCVTKEMAVAQTEPLIHYGDFNFA